jgi:hypothetical protein
VGDPRGAPGADLTASVDLTVFERCDRRHSAVRQRFIFWTTHWERGRKADKGRELPGGNYRSRDRDPGEGAGCGAGGDASEDYEEFIGAKKHLVLGLLSAADPPQKSYAVG